MKFAAVTVLYLGLSAHTHLDKEHFTAVAEAAPLQPLALPLRNAATNAQQADSYEVLSAEDAALYRAAFAAQQTGNWPLADASLALIKDKALIGFVLADRYQRRAATLAQAQDFMARYADMQGADDLYARARKMPGFAEAVIKKPLAFKLWSRSGALSATAGFLTVSDNDDDPAKAKMTPKINLLLHQGETITAREMLIAEQNRGNLTGAAANQIAAQIAAAFFHQGEIEHARPLAHQAATGGIALGLWIEGLSAWKQHDYGSAARSFAALAQTPGLSNWDRSAASFWAYRCAKILHDTAQTRYWLAQAAKYPGSFYGAMAEHIAGNSADHAWIMPDLSAGNVALLRQKKAGWQALALVQIGQNDAAETMLRRLDLNRRDMQVAALALAEQAHMPTLSVELGGVAVNDKGKLFTAAQYPLPPWQPADGFKIDRALLYALIKHESHFDPDAVSHSGACGLMQLMPQTAKRIANDNHRAHGCPDLLFDPATNVTLGQKYVRVLAAQPAIGSNLLYLLAAYNAGPGNLQHWLAGADRRDPLLFIESLPLRETRDYVQHVMLHYWMYRARMHLPETSLTQLAQGTWPRYALHDETAARAQKAQPMEIASAAPLAKNGSR